MSNPKTEVHVLQHQHGELEGGPSMTCKAHEWVVFSRALREGYVMLQCVNCGLHGFVNDSSIEEWATAFHAPSRPYRWHDETRVLIHDVQPPDQPYVQRKPPNFKPCECYTALGVKEPGEYERVWIETTRPKPPVTDEDREELL